MDKRKVFILIFLCFLVTISLCKEEPNHLSAESSSEVIGFKNPPARHADIPLRSRQHKFPVQTSRTKDSFSSDVERIGSLDGRVLPASKNAQKSIKWTKYDKIRNVSTMRMLKSAMRRSARRHNVLKSSHGVGMPSSSEVIGFKNPPARHADVPLRSRQHKFPVQTSTTKDSFSSDVERIGSLDGRVLPASKNAQKSIKWTKDDKIRNVSTMRMLKFAMRRSARRHNVLKSSHGIGMPSSASILKDSKDMKAFTFQKTPPLSVTGLPYKTKITTPFKLVILPTEETVIPSVDKADTESDWLLKEDDTTEQDDQKSSSRNDKEDSSSPHGEPKVDGHEGSTRRAGTSAMPQHKMAVHPGVKASSGLRWKAAYDQVKLDDSKKGKNSKNKKKESPSEDEEPVHSSSPATTVAGILAGILMVLFIFNGVPRLWKIYKKPWRRCSSGENVFNFRSTGYSTETLSDEEIIFDRAALRRNKGASPAPSPTTSPETHAASSSQLPDHSTQQQKIWTLTNTPRSTPLMAVPTLDDSSRTEVWTVNETAETKSLDSLFTTSSLSDLSGTGKLNETPRSVSLTSVSLTSLTSETDMSDPDLTIGTRPSGPVFDLTDETVPSPPPFSTQLRLGTSASSEQTTLESSLSPHKSKTSFCLLPTASNESTPSISMASDGASASTESCKTPVAAGNEVVITMDDDDEKVIHTSDKSGSEVLSVVKDAENESSKQHVVITMGLDDDEESSVISESESSSGEMVYMSQESGTRNVTTRDAIIDIMGSDNDNEETSAKDEKSNQVETPLLTLPTIPPPTASTELPQGKALIGGRKALENRRFIKHLISEQGSTGFRSDLNAAISRILGEKKNLVDKNKTKRIVIKHQTRETKHTLAESILRTKSMIMNENVDRERNKRSLMCRKLIRHTLKYPGQPTQTLAQEIAYAKDIILLGRAHPSDAARPKAKREVRREDESMKSLDRGASTSNSAKIRVLNHKDYKTWKALQKDIKVMKAQGIKPRDVLHGLQVIRDIYNLPRIPVDSEGCCLCYYCEKHIKRAQRKKFFKLPSKLFSFKSKSSSTKESHSDSEGSSFTSSAAAGPSTSSAANVDSGVSSNRLAS